MCVCVCVCVCVCHTPQSLKDAGVTCLSWSEFMDKGGKAPVEAQSAKAEDPCTIMYTSGTTG